MKKKGIHIMLDLFGVEWEKLDDPIYLNKIIDKTLRGSGLKSFGTIYHKFNPHGFTSVTLLEASHLSIHTWPEYGHATIDIYACDDWDKALKAMEIILNELNPKRVEKVIKYRGYIYNPNTKIKEK